MRFGVPVWHDRRMDADSTFQGSLDPVLRRAFRVWRGVSWGLKSLRGKPRTLLVELRWRLGDEIMALPVIDALSAAYPGDRLYVLTNYPDLFEGRNHMAGLNTIPASVDWYLLLRGAARNEYRGAVYARKAGLPLPDARPRLMYENWATTVLDAARDRSRPLIAVAPETTWRTKQWPREHWEALCRVLRARGAKVVELGQHGLDLPVDYALAGKTSVREAACVLHEALVLVSCDNGLMHLARAAGTPVVALFGPTDPDILLRPHPDFVPLRSGLACHGYWNRLNPAPDPERCPLDHECCLSSITVDTVFESVVQRMVRTV
jgi:ADP-heptose:LPS heptosyltransferase